MHACTHISLWVCRLLKPCGSCGMLESSYKQAAVYALMDASILSCCTQRCVGNQSVERSFNCPYIPADRENPLTPSSWGLVGMAKPTNMLSYKDQNEFKFSTLVFVVVF